MMQSNQRLTNKQRTVSFALFNLGFRPFFLFSALSAVILIAIWGLLYTNILQLNSYYGFIGWHSHEMLLGYTGAVVAGFLLTAVRNWTGVDTITRLPLAILVGLWLVARILPFSPVSGYIIALCDIAFWFFMVLAIAHPIIKAQQWHNSIMVVILFLLMLADALQHAQYLGLLDNTVNAANQLAIYSILFMIQVITGRIMPFFTRMAIPGASLKSYPVLEKLLAVLLLSLALIDILSLNRVLAVLLAASLLLAHGVRLASWFSKPVLTVPILSVLYSGYLWLLIGFAMKILADSGWGSTQLAIHAWTLGLIGLTTYGMMVRVTLGHTGRAMIASKAAIIGFYLLFVAALVRVIFPLLWGSQYLLWIELSALLWITAFILFIIVYGPFLLRPRIDGQPG